MMHAGTTANLEATWQVNSGVALYPQWIYRDQRIDMLEIVGIGIHAFGFGCFSEKHLHFVEKEALAHVCLVIQYWMGYVLIESGFHPQHCHLPHYPQAMKLWLENPPAIIRWFPCTDAQLVGEFSSKPCLRTVMAYPPRPLYLRHPIPKSRRRRHQTRMYWACEADNNWGNVSQKDDLGMWMVRMVHIWPTWYGKWDLPQNCNLTAEHECEYHWILECPYFRRKYFLV